MPMGTTEDPQRNPQMGPSPIPPQPDNRGMEAGNPLPNPEHRTHPGSGRPRAAYSDYPQQRDPLFDDVQRRDPSHRHDHAAASTAWDERLRNPSEPWLPDDYDKALVARVYQDVDSGDELRQVAYEQAREVYRLAAEATASVDVPIPGMEDQRDPRTKAREGLRAGIQREQRPNMPMANNPDNRPEHTTPPDQPPGPTDLAGGAGRQPPQPAPGQQAPQPASQQPDHPQGGPPGQTGDHPQGGPPGQQPRPEQHEREERERREKEEQDRKSRGSSK
jgi:hypothetical protein